MSSAVAKINTYFDVQYAKAVHPEGQRDVEKTRGMAIGYVLHYANDGYLTAAIEEQFNLPIFDPVSEQPTGRTYTGIVDAALWKDGLLYFGDHKTASRVDDTYWAELKTNPQLSAYELAAVQLGFPIEGFVWDVIQKPGIAPKKLTKKAVAELENGEYCGTVFEEPYNGEEEETAKMYGRRVLIEYTDNPSRYFQRRIIKRRPEELLEFASDLATITGRMDQARNDASLVMKNRHSCKQFGRMCDFHAYCAGEDDELRGFRHKANLAEDGTQKPSRLVGNKPFSISEIATYMRCPREWKLNYVDLIEPLAPVYSDSLNIGSMLHEALEIFLKDRMGDPITFQRDQ